jgi:hypothetical protein
MPTAMENVARQNVSSDNLNTSVGYLCSIGEKVAGSAEEGRACDYITEKLTEYGIDHQVHTFQSYVSYPISARVMISAPEVTEIEAVGVSFGLSTPEGGFGSKVVAVGGGGEDDYDGLDVAGKIVLVDKLPTPERAVTAARHGVAGMICMSAGKQRHKMIITPVWGTPGYDEANAIPRLHVASISAVDGADLIKWARAGTLEATLITDTFEGWRTVRLPVAEIKGSEPEFTLVGSHYCSWFDGSTDNVTGDSCILELARLIKQQEGNLRYGVRFAWWPGHSHARYSGSTWYADTYWQDLFDHAITYFNIDSPGVKGATVYVPRHQMGEVADFNEETTREITGWTTDTSSGAQLALGKRKDKYVSSTRPSRAADQSFWGVGLSSISVYGMLKPGDPNRDANVGGSGGAWWWHSEHETVDKADMEILSQDTRLYITILLRLVNADVLPFNFTHSAQDFLDALREYAEEAGEFLQFDELTGKAQALQNSVAGLHQGANDLEGAAATARVNRLYLRLARWLNPVLYQKRSAYEHDPALSSRCLPGLGGALVLKNMDPQSDAFKFAVVGLRREMNRIGHHLTEALRMVDDWRSQPH